MDGGFVRIGVDFIVVVISIDIDDVDYFVNLTLYISENSEDDSLCMHLQILRYLY